MHPLMELIHSTDIYKGAEELADKYADLEIAEGHPVFERLLEESRPNLIVDVNNDDGRTAILLAQLAKKRGLRATLVAVNTFLGSLEDLDSKRAAMPLRNGYPLLYEQFLAAVIKRDLQDMIIPFPVPSLVAGRVLGKAWVKADMIHLDASREELDMQLDLLHFEPMLSDVNAVLCGGHHSETAPNLMNAVNMYSEAAVLPLEMMNDKWILWK